MSVTDKRKVEANDARAGKTHDRTWLVVGLFASAMIVVVAFVALA